jgi:hypothetical protein
MSVRNGGNDADRGDELDVHKPTIPWTGRFHPWPSTVVGQTAGLARDSVGGVPTSPILILTGPPGAGKTTTAEPWRPESHEQNALVMGIVGEAAAAYAAAGYFTIIDGIVIPRWFLGPLRDVLVNAGLAVAYAVLRPPLPVCAERVDAREGGPLADGRLAL